MPQNIQASILTPQNQSNVHLNLYNSSLNKCPKPSYWNGAFTYKVSFRAVWGEIKISIGTRTLCDIIALWDLSSNWGDFYFARYCVLQVFDRLLMLNFIMLQSPPMFLVFLPFFSSGERKSGGNINLWCCWIHELYCQTHEQTNFDVFQLCRNKKVGFAFCLDF